MHFLRILLVIGSYIDLTYSSQNGSLPTSVDAMRPLLQIEKSFIESLQKYGEELRSRLEVVRRALSHLRAENEKALKNSTSYLSIPTNTFKLVRRMRQDLMHWEFYGRRIMRTEQGDWLREHNRFLPCRRDFAEAATGIDRFRRSYELPVLEFSSGNIIGRQYDTKLTSLNCFTIGEELYRRQEYSSAYQWIDAALQMYEDDMQSIYDVLRFDRSLVFNLQLEVCLQRDNITEALKIVELALTFYPNYYYFRRMKSRIQMQGLTDIATVNRIPERQPTDIQSLEYLRLCRDDYSNRTTRMNCLYNNTVTPFLKLAPLKMEIVSEDPYLVRFYDVLYDSEIAELQKLTRSRLVRAAVALLDGRVGFISARTAKLAWIQSGLNNITRRIFRRMEDMTGFAFDIVDKLQVQNYGLGGHYDVHPDYFNNTNTKGGDRKATIMFYLNDVEQGGNTVFPFLNLSIIPVKGSAVLWYNLNQRLDPDVRTQHAGCPVLVGSKWVANHWVLFEKQVFRLPCYI